MISFLLSLNFKLFLIFTEPIALGIFFSFLFDEFPFYKSILISFTYFDKVFLSNYNLFEGWCNVRNLLNSQHPY